MFKVIHGTEDRVSLFLATDASICINGEHKGYVAHSDGKEYKAMVYVTSAHETSILYIGENDTLEIGTDSGPLMVIAPEVTED